MSQPPSHPHLECIPCFLCGADDFDVVYEAQYDREKDADPVQKFRASGDELLIDRLVKCRRCTFQYVNPRLRGEFIFSGYTEGDDPTYVSQIDARERTFAGSLGEIERAVGSRGRLLDIGTAAGAFVAAAKARGWEAEGCEPNRWLARWGAEHYSITIRQGSVFEQPYEDGSFDVVTLWDVIEHTLNPREMLERCHRLLKPGGVLVVNYPDIGSSIARALGRRWLFLTSVHLYYFDRHTMTRMLDTTGFRVERLRPHWQRLELDYVLFRGSLLSAALSAAARRIVRAVGAGKFQVPYWLGQTFVIARKHR
jgi:2-polyprenyl-3-methyl-5-hydroxy-6-metoxy-1,4-benzoquinol methylase